MAITRKKKEKIVEELKDKFGKAKSVVFAKYKGLTVEDITDLRGKLRENDGQAYIAKNSLTKIALKGKKAKVPEKLFRGQIAMIFSYNDEMIAPKEAYNFSKENENLQIKGGIFENNFIESEKVEQLAKIPSHGELLAKLVGSLNSPLSGIVNVLQGNLRSLVCALEAIKSTKE